MSVRRVNTFTVLCDRCGADAFAESDYSGWGPGVDNARDVAIEDGWTCDGRGDFCPDCDPDGYRPVVVNPEAIGDPEQTPVMRLSEKRQP